MLAPYRLSPPQNWNVFPFGQNVNSFIFSLTCIHLGDRKLDKLGENLNSVKNDVEEMKKQVILFT